MNIDLDKRQIIKYANQYDLDSPCKDIEKEAELSDTMKNAANRKYMTPGDLMTVTKWKPPHPNVLKLCAENSDDHVREQSTASFAADSDERLRISELIVLRGVRCATASVILHFAFPDCYPIFGRHTMMAVGGTTNCQFESWKEYVDLCRNAATEHQISMRTLDKALWIDGEKKLRRIS